MNQKETTLTRMYGQFVHDKQVSIASSSFHYFFSSYRQVVFTKTTFGSARNAWARTSLRKRWTSALSFLTQRVEVTLPSTTSQELASLCRVTKLTKFSTMVRKSPTKSRVSDAKASLNDLKQTTRPKRTSESRHVTFLYKVNLLKRGNKCRASRRPKTF